MTSRNPECQCEISPDMVWAGPAIQLCHHSSPQEALQVQERLMDLMTNFAQNIDANTMVEKTIIELAEEYRKQAAGRLRRLLTPEEHTIININFLRNLSLAAQTISCTMIIDKQRRGTENDQQRIRAEEEQRWNEREEPEAKTEGVEAETETAQTGRETGAAGEKAEEGTPEGRAEPEAEPRH